MFFFCVVTRYVPTSPYDFKTQNNMVRFQVPTAANMKIRAFWEGAPCSESVVKIVLV
jgi:hypothetical protein